MNEDLPKWVKITIGLLIALLTLLISFNFALTMTACICMAPIFAKNPRDYDPLRRPFSGYGRGHDSQTL